jgi:hypothetical protein
VTDVEELKDIAMDMDKPDTSSNPKDTSSNPIELS